MELRNSVGADHEWLDELAVFLKAESLPRCSARVEAIAATLANRSALQSEDAAYLRDMAADIDAVMTKGDRVQERLLQIADRIAPSNPGGMQ